MDVRLALAIAPVLVCMGAIYRADRYEPEPRELVLTILLRGAFASLLALVAELAFGRLVAQPKAGSPVALWALSAFVGVALWEELVKWLVVKRQMFEHPEFDEPFDGIVYCVAASLGFAAFENVLYVAFGGVGVGIARALTAVPGHAMFGVFMGYLVGRARFASSPERRQRWLVASLLVPIALHGSYDFFLFVEHPGYSLLLLVAMAVVGHYLIHALQQRSPYLLCPRDEEGRLLHPAMFCSDCGSKLLPPALFCSRCGHATLNLPHAVQDTNTI
jgi:protease PrsW